MKKFRLLAALLLFAAALVGCSGLKKELSDEEVVYAFVEAYKQGDYKGIKPYISADNQLNVMFGTIAAGGEDGMAKVYKKAIELTKNAEITAEAVEGRERWGEVTVHVKSQYIVYILDAMDAAIEEQVNNGNEAFKNLPEWILSGLEADEAIDEEVTVHVGNRDGNMVMDTNTNRKFFRYITGGFYDYIDTTLTICQKDDEYYYIAAQGDSIIGMVQTFYADAKGVTDEDLAAFEDSYSSVDGIVASVKRIDSNTAQVQIGIDFDLASSKVLADLGIISGRITASGGYLSLRSTISSFKADGMTCTTETFGAVGLAD